VLAPLAVKVADEPAQILLLFGVIVIEGAGLIKIFIV
jgi:hypothetical protein